MKKLSIENIEIENDFHFEIKFSVKDMVGRKTLAGLSVGESGVVKDVKGNSNVTKRLMEMGIIPGTSVKVVKTAPF